MTIVDDYAHHPAEIAATIAAAREAFPDRRLRALFQPHLVSRTRYLAADLGAALAAADATWSSRDVYLAREPPDPAVTGKLVVDALSDQRPARGVDPTGSPRPSSIWPPDACRPGRRLARAGRRRRGPRAGRDPLPARGEAMIPLREAGVALAAPTPQRSARAARPGTSRAPERSTSSRRCSSGPPATEWRSSRSGSDRTCSPRIDGIDALVLRLGGGLASARGRRRRCSLPVAGRRTPSAFTGRAMPGSGASSSPRRFLARRAAACG